MNQAIHALSLITVLSSFAACAPHAPPPSPVHEMTIELPANTKIKVEATTQTCSYFKRAVVVWPDGSESMFATAAPNPADTAVSYGTSTYTTGPLAAKATVKVFDRAKDTDPWVPTVVRLASPKKVESTGHPNPQSHHWNDTIVTFSW
jgi:hypothetical protein